MGFKRMRVNGGSGYPAAPTVLWIVSVMEIHTSLDEIIGTLKKLKDADPADPHHQDLVKQDTVTVTIETNHRQGDLETGVDGTKGGLTETETESNEALSEWEEVRITDF